MSSSLEQIHIKLDRIEAKLKLENLRKREKPMEMDPRHPRIGMVPQGPAEKSPQQRHPPKDPKFKHLQMPLARARDNVTSDIDHRLGEIMKQTGKLTKNGKVYKLTVDSLQYIKELGTGSCGHVVKMKHKESQEIVAVKQMRRSGNREENKRILMDLDIVLKSHSCPYIVQCMGAIVTPSEVWICMEQMSTCLDKLIKRLNEPIPEQIIGKMVVSIVNGLNYLKDNHGVMHRDVKPSNMLLDEKGTVKLCDFGISGRLVDSKARTRVAGCTAYMAPERIEPEDPKSPHYDVRADVWSLGISLVELATLEFPFKHCMNEFEVLACVLEQDPPRLPPNRGFSLDFHHFIQSCLTKDHQKRPKYPQLMEHSFFKRYEIARVDVASWFAQVLEKIKAQESASRQPPTSTTASATSTTST
ncbi:Dual specificity mitogen-activated protein kinase kinase 7 [Holothuria leucospilota]|uniref:mitogen-activated protein kinase kinase n=1 Tax=Holothuria leucospilota TaxID=206669 RepID=A0A9Q1C572_HOLLE|nr:Dual specificity mitogen-activated protein kinase kinase 7 [Holothuria leucospilota]